MSLVCALILLFISKSLALSKPEQCREDACPPGYYRKSKCGPENRWNLCKECKPGYYTAIQNTERSCLQCTRCPSNMVMTQKCTTVSDRQCVKESGIISPLCPSCLTKRPELTELPRVVECNPLCKLMTTTPHTTTAITTATTTTTTATTNTTSATTTTGGSNVTTTKGDSPAPHESVLVQPLQLGEDPPSASLCDDVIALSGIFHTPAGLDPLAWMLVLVVLLILVFCVCVFLLTNLYKYVHVYCPCWRVKEHAETTLQTDTERGCLQSPTTLDFTIYEETPMLDVMNPVPPGCPANGAPQLSEVEHRVLPDKTQWEPFSAIVMYAVIKEVPLRRWKELMRLLSVADQQLERVELDVGLSSIEKQYQQLRLWSQKPGAKMDDIYSALHYMELMGCAQMIRESLDQIQLRPEGGAL